MNEFMTFEQPQFFLLHVHALWYFDINVQSHSPTVLYTIINPHSPPVHRSPTVLYANINPPPLMPPPHLTPPPPDSQFTVSHVDVPVVMVMKLRQFPDTLQQKRPENSGRNVGSKRRAALTSPNKILTLTPLTSMELEPFKSVILSRRGLLNARHERLLLGEPLIIQSTENGVGEPRDWSKT